MNQWQRPGTEPESNLRLGAIMFKCHCPSQSQWQQHHLPGPDTGARARAGPAVSRLGKRLPGGPNLKGRAASLPVIQVDLEGGRRLPQCIPAYY